ISVLRFRSYDPNPVAQSLQFRLLIQTPLEVVNTEGHHTPNHESLFRNRDDIGIVRVCGTEFYHRNSTLKFPLKPSHYVFVIDQGNDNISRFRMQGTVDN